MSEKDTVDDLLLAAIVAGEEVDAVLKFGEYRARGMGVEEAATEVLRVLDL